MDKNPRRMLVLTYVKKYNNGLASRMSPEWFGDFPQFQVLLS